MAILEDFVKSDSLSQISQSYSHPQHSTTDTWPYVAIAVALTHHVCSLQDGMSNGCLLRRVVVDGWESGHLERALIEAGFQADKLSVWVLKVSKSLVLHAVIASHHLCCKSV